MREDIIAVKFKEVIGEEPLEISRIELGPTIGYIVTSRSYELSIRCNESGRCELMLRYLDQPAITCTTRCYPDPTSNLDEELLRELNAKMVKLIESLGLKLLQLDDLW